jgi:cell wall-associated NlpC family hydrolase
LILRVPIVRRCAAALIAWSLIVTILAVSPATAEDGIPAGTDAMITAGAPLLVRATPGWDAEISYEIADGSSVTVWGAEQAASDGSLWYPVDGGFVPADAVTSVSTLKGGVTLSQDAADDASVGGWVDPAPAVPADADIKATDQGIAPASTDEWVDSATIDAATDPPTDNAPDQTTTSVDPVTDAWVDPATVDPLASTGGVDPTTGEWSDPATTGSTKAKDSAEPATEQGLETAPVATPVDPVSVEVLVDSATSELVEATPEKEPVEPLPVDAVTEPVAADGWAEPAPASGVPTGIPEAASEPITTAYITNTDGNGAPCLAAPERGTETLAVLDEGVPVEVRAEAMGEWQPVNCAGAGGYVRTSLIAWEPSTTSVDSVELEQKTHERDGASGNEIVDFAMRYEGRPYVYAGEGPKAFDCSGFTMFVIQKTLSIDITHDMSVQYDMGSHVRRNALQPGDLVFFKNTSERGLSHTGIYIGDGQFIHAENESTGVRISDLDSDYYSSHWYGAARYS